MLACARANLFTALAISCRLAPMPADTKPRQRHRARSQGPAPYCALVALTVLAHLAYAATVFAGGHGSMEGEPGHHLIAQVQDLGQVHGEDACDHCCHAGAHLTALPSSYPDTRFHRANPGDLPANVRLVSHDPPPPKRPPKPSV
jgi:hypothetical protein